MVFGQMNEPPGARLRVALSRPDDGRAVPRRVGQGDDDLRRQHLPLHPGGLRGVGAARAYALRGGLPADALDRDGRAAGADHLDQPGRHHLGAGDLRAGGRPDRPRAGDGVRPPRRVRRSRARHRREGHLPRRRPARVDLDDPRPRDHRRAPLRREPAGPADPAAVQGPAGHHRDPRRRRALRRGQADRVPRPEDRALPVAAVLRRRGLHGLPGRLHEPGRHDRLVRASVRGRGRRPARVGVHVRRHAGRRPCQGREGRPSGPRHRRGPLSCCTGSQRRVGGQENPTIGWSEDGSRGTVEYRVGAPGVTLWGKEPK
jgi:hypothetical protein